MRRREFITGVGGTAAWSLAVNAQQRVPVIGILGGAPDNSEGRARVAAYRQALQGLGRIDGSNVRLDVRLFGDDLVRVRANAAELARMGPAMILAIGTPALVALREVTRTIPIVFANVSDPVDGGFIESEARPGGNITGFTSFEYSVASKWLELLKEVRPRMLRVLVLLNPDNYTSRGLLRSIQAAAPAVGVRVVAARVSAAAEIAPAFTAFTGQPDGGLIVTPDALTSVNLGHIIALSNQHRLPSIYPFRFYPATGGLLSYGTEIADIFRGAADYSDRILKGEKPSELPVQNPTRYRLVINLKAAKAIGIEISPMMLTRADEVIE
jgi:putative tryptophan/tyrosine transport system substrate-binding protein